MGEMSTMGKIQGQNTVMGLEESGVYLQKGELFLTMRNVKREKGEIKTNLQVTKHSPESWQASQKATGH